MIKITVIIPTYRPKEYLDRALNCLFCQTLSISSFETLIVLNGPKHPYWDNLYRFQEKHKNLRLLYNDKPGVSNARNFGLERAKGEYICFLDDDDWVSENYLETMFEMLQKQGKKNDIAQSNLIAVKKGIPVNDYISDAYLRLSGKTYSVFRYRKFLSNVGAKLYHRNTIGGIRFRSNLKIAEDAVFLFELSRNIRTILLTDENCVYYRDVREGSVLRRKRKIEEILANYFKKIGSYFQIYCSSITSYSFPLFISRLIASSKMFVKEILDNSKY